MRRYLIATISALLVLNFATSVTAVVFQKPACFTPISSATLTVTPNPAKFFPELSPPSSQEVTIDFSVSSACQLKSVHIHDGRNWHSKFDCSGTSCTLSKKVTYDLPEKYSIQTDASAKADASDTVGRVGIRWVCMDPPLATAPTTAEVNQCKDLCSADPNFEERRDFHDVVSNTFCGSDYYCICKTRFNVPAKDLWVLTEPTLDSPKKDDKIANPIKFEWSYPGTSAPFYHLKVYKKSPSVVSEFTTADKTKESIIGMSGQVYWKVRACVADTTADHSCGDFPAEVQFEIVECDKNDLDTDGDGTNDRSSQCNNPPAGQEGRRGVCILPPLTTDLNTCDYPTCRLNSQCDANYCCGSTTAGGPGGTGFAGECKQPGTRSPDNKFICTT